MARLRRAASKSRWRIVLVAGAVVGVVCVLFGGEVVWALKAPRLPERAPLDLNRTGNGDRVVWLGDSTAAGVGASGPSAALPQLLAEPDDQILSLAVSGATIGDVVSDQLPQVPVNVERIYISIGANDTTGLTSRNDFEQRYRDLLRRLPADADVTVLGVPDMGSPPRFLEPLSSVAAFRGRQLDKITRRCADAAGASYVDIAQKTGPRFRKDPSLYFAADDFHPSDEGYRLWAQAVKDN